MQIETVIKILKEVFGERCSTDAQVLKSHGKDYSFHEVAPPNAVVSVKTEEEVVQVVKLCNEYGVPIISYGSGTSLEGHINAPKGGISLSFHEMRQIEQLNPLDMDVVVQPGLPFTVLNKFLERHGLYFPLDAGPNASIGGMVSTSASGTRAVRYGTMKENVLSLRVVLADGRVIKTGNRARKMVAGYDLTHLFVGSEGTLGVITQITLKLHRIPPHRASVLVHFPSVIEATNAVMELMRLDVQLSMVELLDELMMKALNMKFGFKYALRPTLYLEFAGASQVMLQEQERIVHGVTDKFQGGDFLFAKTEKDREELFKARKLALLASSVLSPGTEVWTTDVSVPISKLTTCIAETRADLDKSFLKAPIVGHAGDGNFHVFILLDPHNQEHLKEANRLNKNLISRALAMGGTCTGEHGVGLGKRDYLIPELGLEAVQLMKQIKLSLDPKDIMNPGKVIPHIIQDGSTYTNGNGLVTITAPTAMALHPSRDGVVLKLAKL